MAEGFLCSAAARATSCASISSGSRRERDGEVPRALNDGFPTARRTASAEPSAASRIDRPASGPGGVGLELLDELPDVDTILVAVGGGGLMGGIAAAAEGRAQVVGVEPETVPTLHTALAQGEPVDVAVSGIAADSLGARRIGEIGFGVARRTGVRSVLVSDEDIVTARRALWENYRIVVEHGAAAAYAALLSGAYAPRAGETVAVILCGANTDPAHF